MQEGKLRVVRSQDGETWESVALMEGASVGDDVRDAKLSLTGDGRLMLNGAITFKGTGEFLDDDETKEWFYRALAKKVSPDSKEGEEAFYSLLSSPLRTILAVTPVKRIMYNGGLAERHMAGTVDEKELGERLSGDRERMNAERAKRGLPPR